MQSRYLCIPLLLLPSIMTAQLYSCDEILSHGIYDASRIEEKHYFAKVVSAAACGSLDSSTKIVYEGIPIAEELRAQYCQSSSEKQTKYDSFLKISKTINDAVVAAWSKCKESARFGLSHTFKASADFTTVDWVIRNESPYFKPSEDSMILRIENLVCSGVGSNPVNVADGATQTVRAQGLALSCKIVHPDRDATLSLSSATLKISGPSLLRILRPSTWCQPITLEAAGGAPYNESGTREGWTGNSADTLYGTDQVPSSLLLSCDSSPCRVAYTTTRNARSASPKLEALSGCAQAGNGITVSPGDLYRVNLTGSDHVAVCALPSPSSDLRGKLSGVQCVDWSRRTMAGATR